MCRGDVKIAGPLMGKSEESGEIRGKGADELHQDNQGISSIFKVLSTPCRTDFKFVVSTISSSRSDAQARQ